jgi:hypothetical protein
MSKPLRFRVKIDYPNSYFKPGDILEQSERIPPGCIGKFIDETTGWAWVTEPFKYPHIFEPLQDF